jgi:pre-mRNA-processing factor 8
MTRRAYDVPLVNQWFHEHCAQDYPVKVSILKSAENDDHLFL